MNTPGASGFDQTLDRGPDEALAATSGLLKSFSRHHSRRRLLQGGIAAAAATALTSATALSALAVHAEATAEGGNLTEFFNILATGETLFVTFYHQAVLHQEALGLAGAELNAIEAIQTEEELHRRFALEQGGTAATTHFSFPYGLATFESRELFLKTQKIAEELTNWALLAWINDMASMGQVRLAQIGGQLMQVEGGHRVVGRVLQGEEPWDDWAFGPVMLQHFSQVPAAATEAGFLSPRPGNDFEFQLVPAEFPGVIHTSP